MRWMSQQAFTDFRFWESLGNIIRKMYTTVHKIGSDFVRRALQNHIQLGQDRI